MSTNVLLAPLGGAEEGMEVNERQIRQTNNIGTIILCFIEIGLVKKMSSSQVWGEAKID
jgi:hypothetical protein